jgi:hypothetical protein
MSKPCNVYIIGHQHPVYGDAVKVGITSNLGARLASLQTGSCEPLCIFFTAMLPNKEAAARIERQFHDYFHDYRLRGEWFSMPPDRAMFMLGNLLSDVIDARPAFEPFHVADYDTQADWVNDWCTRMEARLPE